MALSNSALDYVIERQQKGMTSIAGLEHDRAYHINRSQSLRRLPNATKEQRDLLASHEAALARIRAKLEQHYRMLGVA